MIANTFIAHESPFDSIGAKAGGAALVAFEQNKTFGEIDPLNQYCLLSPAKTDGQRLDKNPCVEYFKKPNLTGTALANYLAQPYELERFYQLFKGAKFNYGHYFVAGKVLAELKSRLEAPFIFKAHTWDKIVCYYDKTRAPNEARIKMESDTLKKADLIIIATEAEKQDLAKIYADAEISTEDILKKTFVASLGVNYQKYNPANSEKLRKISREKFIPEKLRAAKVFFMLGRMVPEKRHLAVLQAFAKFLKKNPTADAALAIFGGPLLGPYYEKIQYFIKTLPPEIAERIIFEGVQPAIEAIAAGDVFVGPSSWESWYLALVEAMACGKPSITTDTPVLREVTQGLALYVDPEKEIVEEITLQMEKLFSDSSLYHDLEIKSRQLDGAYEWRDSCQKILQKIAMIS